MPEYFVISHSFAAPFISDVDESFIKGKDPKDAMTRFRKGYKHPAGLYSAGLYKDANAAKRGRKALALYFSGKAKKDAKEV